MSDARVETNGFGAPGSVEAYEEDWYRSLRALAERRRGEAGDLDQATPEEDASENGQPPADAASMERELVAGPSQADGPSPANGTVDDEGQGPGGGAPVVVLDLHATPEPVVERPHEPEEQKPLAETQLQPAAEALPQMTGAEPEPRPAAESSEALAGPAPEAEPTPAPTGPSLTSRDPGDRRIALLELTDREATHEELEAVTSLILDPDAEVRELALQTLARDPERLDAGTVRQALQDPSDGVRSAAVRVAAARGISDVGLLMPLVGARRWPDTQRTVLDLLPTVLLLGSLTAEDLDPLLRAVAELDPPPVDWEREALGRVAAAVDPATLIDALTLPDTRRLGAVRLLAGDRTPAVLQALAERGGDPLEEIRAAGTAAADELTRTVAAETRPEAPLDIAELARALRSAVPVDVEGALTSLASVDRADIVAWADENLRSADAGSVALVASVAAVLDLAEVGVELLERGAALPAARRRAVVDGLAEFADPERLAGFLAGVSAQRRAEAVHMVWQAGGPRVIPQLRALLTDPSVQVRAAVVGVLGESGDPASLEAAAGLLLTDASPEVRAAVVRAIARAGAAITDLSRALQDPDAVVRAAAIENLPADPADAVGPILATALADRDEHVRRAAMGRLVGASAGDRELAWSALRQCRAEERDDLVEAFQQTDPALIVELAFERLYSADEAERALAIEVVGWGSTQACVEAAIRALVDPSPFVRRMAVDSLGRLRDRSAVTALGKALGDPDPHVRSGAVRALGVIDDEGVLSYLVSALKDPDHGVRETASHVLTEWSSPAVAKRLAGVLAVPSLRESAADLLMRIGPTSVELLIDVLFQGSADVRATVGPLLYNLVGVEEFVGRMDSLEPERRLRAAEALGAIGGPDAVDALAAALSDPDERLRLRAAQLLGDLGDPRVAGAVARLLDDPVPEVAEAARETLETSLDRRGGDA